MVSMTEMAISSQHHPAKPSKVKEKKSAGAGQSNTSGIGLKGRSAPDRKPDPLELEMARQDLIKVTHPDTQTPFNSLEDACERLLPYHIFAEYDMEDTVEKGGTVLSKTQALEETLTKKTQEFMATFEKQIALYNSIIKKQSEGEMRGEERMMMEQSLLQDEKQKLLGVRAEIEAKEKAEREAAEAKAKEALEQAEKARAEALARAEAQARAEAAQAEAESKAQAEAQARLDGNMSAGPPDPISMAGVSGISMDEDWLELHGEGEDEEDDEDENDEGDEDGDEDGEEDLEGVWDDDGDEDEESDALGVTKMLSDSDNSPSPHDRVSRPP